MHSAPQHRLSRVVTLGVTAMVGTALAIITGATPATAQQAPRYAWIDARSWVASGHTLRHLPAARLLRRQPTNGVTPSDVPDPDLRTQCATQAAAPTSAGWIKSRFEACFHQQQNLLLVRNDNQQQVGTLSFDEWILAFAYDGSRRVDFVPSIENIQVSTAPGYDARTWSIDMKFNTVISSGPAAGLTRPANEDRNDLLGAWNSTPQWTLTYASSAAAVPTTGSILATNSTVALSADAAGAASWHDPVGRYSNVRYDSAGTGGMKVNGTVFTDARVTFAISLSDPTVPQSARHFDDALHHPERTFPSFVGKNVPGENAPLHRLTNSAQQTANNDAAVATCKAVWGQCRVA